jgi:hypothetical protein
MSFNDFPISIVNNPLVYSVFEDLGEDIRVAPGAPRYLITDDGRYITTDDGRYLITDE